MNYQTLKQGDVRKPGDEVKPLKFPGAYDKELKNRNSHISADWQPVSPGLLNIPIDFHHVKTAEYRRPLP